MPHRKVAVGALAGALVTVGLWVGATFFSLQQPDFVAAAEVVLVSFLLSYVVPAADQAA